MMAVMELEPLVDAKREAWELRGMAQIDDRPPVPALLQIRPTGSWTAQVATFTFAGQVDVMFFAAEGGHFCGPAFVEISRANNFSGLAMGTELRGSGPLLVVEPSNVPELPAADDMLDAEVVDD